MRKKKRERRPSRASPRPAIIAASNGRDDTAVRAGLRKLLQMRRMGKWQRRTSMRAVMRVGRQSQVARGRRMAFKIERAKPAMGRREMSLTSGARKAARQRSIARSLRKRG